MTDTIKAAELFVRCLEAEGVKHIFGVPGEENADLMIALESSDIRFILCRHEQAAAFMADAYGRLTGRPGVCLATLGPGATNLVTGIADANMDRAPLVAIIGQASTRRLHKESHQNMDAVAMMRPITKWAQGIARAETIPEVIRKPFRIATAEKPAATVIELPEDVAKVAVSGRPLGQSRTRRPAADHKAVARALELIEAAKRPVVLAGNGALRKQASRQLRRFARKTGIPVVNTFMGKGALSLEDPLSLFTAGLQGGDHINQLFDAADLVVPVGYDLVEYAPTLWNRGGDKTIVHIDFEPAEIDSDYPVRVELVADVADSLWQLNEAINAVHGGRLPLFDPNREAPLRRRIHADLTAEAGNEAFPMKPQRILAEVRQALGPDDIVLSDVGAHKMWVARHYHSIEPNTCLISNGFCSMGFALPGGIGAKIARPERRVVAIAGDGGFMMNLQDLETAQRLAIPFVALVWVDGGYGLIKWKQQTQFDGRHSELDFGNPDFEALATAFRVWGRQVRSAGDFAGDLAEALAQPGPALLAVPVDYGENLKLSDRLGNLDATI